MFVFKLCILTTILNMARCGEIQIPLHLKLGTASSSYQVEGAWNVSDKAESIQDRYMHPPFTAATPPAIVKGDNGDVTADSYHHWQRDVEMLDELGVDFYRFSINWPRLLPQSFPHYISEDGSNYYNNLIDALLARGIEPVVTLYHWELPQKLQDLGGWTNPLMIDWFVQYAEVVFKLYGDRVKTWLTFNEPINSCDLVYTTGWTAPGVVENVYAPYLCNRHQLLAHARTWRMYQEKFKEFGGKMSIANHVLWVEPYSDEDKNLTELVLDYVIGRYAHPIFSKEGGWPPVLEQHMAKVSLEQGYKQSKLPAFTAEEIELIRGTYDFFALNHYTSRLVRAIRPDDVICPFFYFGIEDLGAMLETDPMWDSQFAELLLLNPPALRAELSWVQRTYGDIEVFISETGFASAGDMDDQDRCHFIRDHLEQVLLSIYEDGVNVSGYTYWSLMDSFEWLDGFEVQFGLYSVDMSSADRRRTPRASAAYMASLTRNRTLLLPDI